MEENNRNSEKAKIFSDLLINLSKQMSTPEWQKIIENQQKFVASIGTSMVNLVQSEAVQAMGRLAEKLQEYVIALPKIEISEKTRETFYRWAFLDFLSEIQWPMFLIDDMELKNKLKPYMNGNAGKYDMEAIKKEIFEFLDDEKIINMVSSWKGSSVIDVRRIPILQEALELYKAERYYGCVSTLICQLEGIITETYQLQIDNGMEFTAENIKAAYEHYNPDKDFPKDFKIRNEKNKLLCMVTETQEGFIYWMKVVGYIYNVILTSDEAMNQSAHPCRNKICHGIQLNFGTKEHALKALLSIDMVINLAEEMKRVIDMHLIGGENK